MAKIAGKLAALYMQTTAASQSASATAMSQVGSTLWYQVDSSTYYFWDKANDITIYDGVTEVTPVEIDYAAGAVLLSEEASGDVTADHYYFVSDQVAGFRGFNVDENMNLVECGCMEDDGEAYEATAYSASGSADGFYTTVNASLTTSNGSNKDLTFTSKVIGDGPSHDGVSTASIECVVSGSGTSLSIDVTGSDITINSATDGAGDASSTARDVRDALQADEAAMALIGVKIAAGQDGSGIFGELSHTHMSGGVAPAAFDRFSVELIAEFYWDSGVSLIRTSGVITLEKVSLKTSLKELVGKTISWKAIGKLYDHAG
ncbi:MAG: hypothetical protein WC124_02040 [Desulfoplanes sp.]